MVAALDFNLLFYLIAIRGPLLIAILFGAFLCFRYAGRKTRAVKLTSLAIALMVAGSGMGLLVPLLPQMGIDLLGLQNSWMAISVLMSLPHAVALGILFWAIFGDEPLYLDGDDGPPVYRYDDRTTPDGRLSLRESTHS